MSSKVPDKPPGPWIGHPPPPPPPRRGTVRQEPRPQSPTQQIVEIAVRYANPGVNLRDHAFCRLVRIASELTYDELQEVCQRLQAERAGS